MAMGANIVEAAQDAVEILDQNRPPGDIGRHEIIMAAEIIEEPDELPLSSENQVLLARQNVGIDIVARRHIRDGAMLYFAHALFIRADSFKAVSEHPGEDKIWTKSVKKRL